ncbi:MAG: transcriptional regulator [Halopseudomonas sp.]|uniref:helix-turn-helix domain-containing protein n=1 Tax=Halopseudomonas sp. TaxID=2901191 RepID=UPI003001FC8D
MRQMSQPTARRYGELIVEERERLGLKREQLAELIGYKRAAIEAVEGSSQRQQTYGLLAKLAVCGGLDAHYIVTGQRYAPLAADEQKLLEHYRSLDETDQATARRAISALAST